MNRSRTAEGRRRKTEGRTRQRRAGATMTPLDCVRPAAFRLLLPVILLLTLPLSGCQRGGEPGILVIAIEVAPRGFDPRFSTSFQTSARIMQLIYDTLVVRNEKFEFVPSLAERFEES